MKEYLRGVEHELYCVTLSPAFSRQFFNVVVHQVGPVTSCGVETGRVGKAVFCRCLQAFVLWGVTVLGVETLRSVHSAAIAVARDHEPTEQQMKVLKNQQAAQRGLVCAVFRRSGRRHLYHWYCFCTCSIFVSDGAA
jgi:hypothetical protein